MKPKLLDLYCGAGGAAMGYYRAGFEVIGVDIKPQPHYPFEFHQADALTYPLEGFDAYHASPPCQYYSRLRYLPWLRGKNYWRSVPPTIAKLRALSAPWVIENVEDCWDMPDSIILCGQMFGLPIFRHRRFEASFLLLQPYHEKHHFVIASGSASLGKRRHGMNAWNGEAGPQSGVERHKRNMGIDWMTGTELAQAIPPAYTENIGMHLMREVMRRQRSEPNQTRRMY